MYLKIIAVTALAVAFITGGYHLFVVHAEESNVQLAGYSTDNISIVVHFASPQYTLGDQAEYIVDINNVGQAPKAVIRSNPYTQYRLALYDENGNPVKKSENLQTIDSKPPNQIQGVYRMIIDQVAPGKKVSETFALNDSFIIDKAGTYQMIVIRQVDSSPLSTWEKGFAISNLAKVEFVEPKD
jgi:hypothetical protein